VASERAGLELAPAGIVAKALLAAVALMALKFVLHGAGLEPIESLPLLTALMGGVVFTLAILFAGVLTDFKESERLVGELASQLRRLYHDTAVIAQGEALAAMRAALLGATRSLASCLRTGEGIRGREVYTHLDRLDQRLQEASRAGAPAANLRTVQVDLGNLTRMIDRLETIIETTFVRAAYYYAGAVVGVVLLGLALTRIEPFAQGLFLSGFGAFLLVGLFLLIAGLDNPFHGAVRISTRQLEKFEGYLAGWVEGP
jgi:hypothetical protein